MASLVNKVKRLITDPVRRFGYLNDRGFYRNMDDKEFLSKSFELRMGRKMNWDNPETFNEKLQWLKVYNRNPVYTVMADKYLAREYVGEKLGEDYLIPLLGVYDTPDEIDFNALPDQFVLKCNHNSGKGMCICRRKADLDMESVRDNLRKGMQEDYYLHAREYCYKNIQRKIIAEKYMEDESAKDPEKGLIDYKFYCFHGIPKFLHVSQGWGNHDMRRISFVNMDWSLASFCRTDYSPLEKLPPKPAHYEEMIQIAKILSRGCPFLRVDLYEINGKVYFGETTFFPGAGTIPFQPEEADREIGALLDLSMIKHQNL